MKTYKRLTALLLSMLMVVSLAAPAFSFTIAVVTTEKAPGAGELISPDGLVTIAYNVDAGIPEGATVEVSEVDSEDYLPSVNLSGQKIVDPVLCPPGGAAHQGDPGIPDGNDAPDADTLADDQVYLLLQKSSESTFVAVLRDGCFSRGKNLVQLGFKDPKDPGVSEFRDDFPVFHGNSDIHHFDLISFHILL